MILYCLQTIRTITVWNQYDACLSSPYRCALCSVRDAIWLRTIWFLCSHYTQNWTIPQTAVGRNQNKSWFVCTAVHFCCNCLQQCVWFCTVSHTLYESRHLQTLVYALQIRDLHRDEDQGNPIEPVGFPLGWKLMTQCSQGDETKLRGIPRECSSIWLYGACAAIKICFQNCSDLTENDYSYQLISC